MRTRPPLGILLATAALLAHAACPDPSSVPVDPEDRGSGGPVLARVNGRPIVEADVQYVLDTQQRKGHGAKGMTEQRRAIVLEKIIGDELVYQRALELGLDEDPGYLETVARLEAQLAALKREELGDLYYRREILGRAEVTTAETRAYFDEHADELRTEVHVLQILRKDRRSIDEAAAELAVGASFEEVAARPFAGIDADGLKPWDLGWLRYGQVPESWAETVITLQPGEVSGVIEGPRDRFWIIQVADRRIDDGVTFESIEAALKERLAADKLADVERSSKADLRSRADIEYRIDDPATP